MICSNNKQYIFRVYLLIDFFSFCLQMIVSNFLLFLRMKNGDFLSGSDGCYYIYGSRDGCIVICYFKLCLWNDNNILY